MRLHRLRVTAFGPFAGTEEVDLDALCEHGLFLLHGPTGAGKTSVLDAVCFALYGRVPGARHGGGRLRSDHAPEGAAPQVLLELTAAGRRLEVTRSPAWQRPKRRGTGTTDQPAAIAVRELVDGQWVPRSHRLDEASQLLDDVLGMGLEQFTRVVMLPQGEFATFLRARAEDRRELLQRLFGTDRFAQVEQWLAEQRASLRRQLDAVDAEVDRLVARAHQAAAGLRGSAARDDPAPDQQPAPDEQYGEPGGPPDPQQDPAGHVAALHARARAVEQRAGDDARARQRELDAAVDARERAGRRGERLERLAATVELRDELDGREAGIGAAAAAATRAAAAESVRGHLDAVAGAQRAATDAAGRLHAARAAATSGVPDDRLAEVASALRGEAGALRELLAAEQELARCTGAAADLDQRRAAVAQQADVLVGRAARLQAERAGHAEVLARTADAEAELVTQRAGLADAERVAAAATERDRLAEQLQAAVAALRRAVDEAQRRREAWHDLRERRLAGMAAELASGLRPGVSCPVCGALDHPAPAPAGPDPVSAELEDQARRRAEQAADQRAARERDVTAVQHRHDAARAGCEDLTREQAALRSAAARTACSRAEQAVAERRAALAAEQQARAAAESVRGEHQRHLAALAAADAELAALRQRVATLTARLEQARGEDATLAGRRERLTAEAERHDAVREALTAWRDADAGRQRCLSAAERAARGAGFADLADVTAAALGEAARAELQQRLREHAKRRAAVAASLADPELAPLVAELSRLPEGAETGDAGSGAAEPGAAEPGAAEPGAAEPGAALVAAAEVHEALEAARAALPGHRQRVEALRRDRDEATGRRAVAVRAVADLADLATHVAAALAAAGPLRERHDLAADLAACAAGSGGDNALRMRLSAFVLAARLEQVAQAATIRLQLVSGGRYALRHSDAAERGGARSGLGLLVLDAWTGVERDPGTLSGGESFLASLSLALGLADVVQAEAGGAAIETLFVDEGFGTLDEESLEEAVAVLDGLREGGRAVGVVSHVPELRQRVPARLEVRKTRQGSHLRTAIGVAAG